MKQKHLIEKDEGDEVMALIQAQFYSKMLKRIVNFSALLPVDTRETPGTQEMPKPESMKTLYLLHGYTGNYMDWLYGTRIQELSSKYSIAVIMPSGDNSFYLDQKEKEEWYGEFIGNELLEITRKMFCLSDQYQDTYIGGLSMGGFGAIRNGLKYSDKFRGIIGLSSALIIHNIANITPDYKDDIASYEYYRAIFGDLKQLLGSENDPEGLVEGLQNENKIIPDIYMACGTEDFLLEENRNFHQFLNEKNISHTYLESSGNHDWKFWDEYIEKAILWMISHSILVERK